MTRHGEPSLAQEVYRLLEEWIVTLVIAPGERLTEQELTKVTGFGRTPVREAVQRLERDMLVRILPRRGILIEPIDVPRALMAIDVRERVEPLIMERAARLSDAEERREFARLGDRMEASVTDPDATAFTRADREFNELAMQCAHQEVASRVVLPLHAISRRIGYFRTRQNPGQPDAAALTHAGLARAVAADDRSALSAAMAELFGISREVTLAVEAEERNLAPAAG